MQPTETAPPLLSVVIPVYNERVTIRRILDRVRAVPLRKEIIVVDDASTDGTSEILREIAASPPDDAFNTVRVVFHEKNAGKGAAVRTGIEHVTGEITIFQDADLEYSPEEYPQLLEPILQGHADVVFGSRFLSGPHRVLFFWHMLGNQLLTFLSNLCTDLNLTDMETCYKVFRTEVLRRIRIRSNRFGIEPEITAKVARLGCRVYEVPISYHGRDYWEGKKIGWKDGVAAIWTVFRYSFGDESDDVRVGHRHLQRLRYARRYDEWTWSRIAPYVGDRVLEVGSGLGTFTRFLRNRQRVLATEDNPHCLERLRNSFEYFDNIEIREVDWANPPVDLGAERFDTVLCINALEHMGDDDAALSAFATLLEPGGRLLLQVPAMPRLYGAIDRAIGYRRRYDRDELVTKLGRHGFDVEDARYSNLPGMLAWYVNSVVLRRNAVPGLQARLARALVPWLRWESRWRPAMGMSLIAVARKGQS